MYQDINGRKGYRSLQGNTKLWGNTKLLTPGEIVQMIADGIVEIPDPVPPTPSPAALERLRRRRIRGMAQQRVVYHLFGGDNDGEVQEARTVIEIIDALTALAVDLVQAGVLTAPQINQKMKDLRDSAVQMRQARQAAAQAITNGDSVDAFKAALDAIIPDPDVGG